ncbi:class IIb bacteriocin, lactobin A/cerein 7B family [Sharpea azabuensis]|uniref:Class IIb bacteriocin, lactobin A/cerein 7B family n=1 Tax=Sharpea porci TaxID=2652286 RepID=A0A844FSK9_9FIRM|nr:class IIb bacteriocin, lactobin A/cerein 7B family [Sharpea porci]MDD6712013.1 class IIb bacteriocin, lactobin A/cerein 7B family [Sharpea porci]MDY5279969.1 class IIb bacteriocin, lactobin A/cerein 7B family [Sharpea porci]MST88379.1 class IIb bacteriocin, lactobin A/cerein 7B family [Sharpea porci]
MYELTEMEMQSINGGSALIYLIYVILGVGAYKLLRSKRGRMSLPRLIQIEWG